MFEMKSNNEMKERKKDEYTQKKGAEDDSDGRLELRGKREEFAQRSRDAREKET